MCPEAMVLDRVGGPHELLEGQLNEKREKGCNYELECKQENREEKRKQSPGDLTVSVMGHHSAVIRVSE